VHSSPRARPPQPPPRQQQQHDDATAEDDDEHVNTSCGIGTWRPEWLQVFATPMHFMLNMAIIGIIQGMTGTLFFSSISAFEKRYSFDSKVSGIILIADNFAEMIVSF